MSTHLKGRYEELVKKKDTRVFLFGAGAMGVLLVCLITAVSGVGGPLAPIMMMATLPLMGIAIASEATPEEKQLAESEKQKRIAEQVAFDDSVRKIHRDHKLNQISQGLVQRAAPKGVPVEDPQVANIRRQGELQSKQLAYEIKLIAERIRTLKHLERDGLGVMEDLVEAKIIDAEEAAMFKELIKDKVMEGIHVDRRGGRSRHNA